MVDFKLNEEEYLSPKEFAKLLKVHLNTVYRMVKSGRLICVRLNEGEKSHYRIPRSEINRIAHCDLEKIIRGMVEENKK